jgi:hypothetical protein
VSYEICYLDTEGNEQTAEGETLEALSAELAEQGYEGASIRVTDEAGFTRGWVSAKDWRAA